MASNAYSTRHLPRRAEGQKAATWPPGPHETSSGPFLCLGCGPQYPRLYNQICPSPADRLTSRCCAYTMFSSPYWIVPLLIPRKTFALRTPNLDREARALSFGNGVGVLTTPPTHSTQGTLTIPHGPLDMMVRSLVSPLDGSHLACSSEDMTC